jgi:hypothetical protein
MREIAWGFVGLIMGAILGVLALGVGYAWAYHSPESCGRMLIKRAEKAKRRGETVGYFPATKQCPRIRLPNGYWADPMGLPSVFVVYRDNGSRLVRVQMKEQAVKEAAKLDGVHGLEVWDNGRLAGKVVVHE